MSVNAGCDALPNAVDVAMVTALEDPANGFRYSPIEPLIALLWGISLLSPCLVFCVAPVFVRIRPGVKWAKEGVCSVGSSGSWCSVRSPKMVVMETSPTRTVESGRDVGV